MLFVFYDNCCLVTRSNLNRGKRPHFHMSILSDGDDDDDDDDNNNADGDGDDKSADIAATASATDAVGPVWPA